MMVVELVRDIYVDATRSVLGTTEVLACVPPAVVGPERSPTNTLLQTRVIRLVKV